MDTLTSGQLAKAANVNGETLRYYEREGLLSEPGRAENGYRQYAEEDVRRVRFIKKAQGLGFTLKEIKSLLTLTSDETQTASTVKQLALEKIRLIDEKIASLQAMRGTLETLTQSCDGAGPLGSCPILQSLQN